jgi:glycosyltransferase involved in cell wall biosynthesis
MAMKEFSRFNGAPEFLAWSNSQGSALNENNPHSMLQDLLLGPTHSSLLVDESLAREKQSRHLRVLTAICQKIGSTGSGIVVRELVERAAEQSVEFLVICGSTVGDLLPPTLRHKNIDIRPVLFGGDSPMALPFPIVGMSDRMPYESIRFLDLKLQDLDLYLNFWRQHLIDAIADFRPHLIHVHHLWLLAAICASCAPNTPIIVSMHGTDLQQARNCPHFKALIKPWVSRFVRISALTEEGRQEAAGAYSLPADRFLLLGNGFNEQLFRPVRVSNPTVIRRYRLETFINRRIVLFVGKFVEWKGIEWLLRSFAQVIQTVLQDATLVIAGTGPEEERQRYASLARELRIENHVHMIGEIRYEDVGEVMNLATVFVLPSFHEPFGLVLLEALACGLRVIATDQGGPPSFVPHALRANRDAILIFGLPAAPPTKNAGQSFIDRLAKALAEQIAKPLPIEKRCEISISVSDLTWNAYVSTVLGLYKQVARSEGTHV